MIIILQKLARRKISQDNQFHFEFHTNGLRELYHHG